MEEFRMSCFWLKPHHHERYANAVGERCEFGFGLLTWGPEAIEELQQPVVSLGLEHKRSQLKNRIAVMEPL